MGPFKKYSILKLLHFWNTGGPKAIVALLESEIPQEIVTLPIAFVPHKVPFRNYSHVSIFNGTKAFGDWKVKANCGLSLPNCFCIFHPINSWDLILSPYTSTHLYQASSDWNLTLGFPCRVRSSVRCRAVGQTDPHEVFARGVQGLSGSNSPGILEERERKVLASGYATT